MRELGENMAREKRAQLEEVERRIEQMEREENERKDREKRREEQRMEVNRGFLAGIKTYNIEDI